MNKRLVLNRDVLVDLTTDDLLRVPAGTVRDVAATRPVTTVNVACPSNPATACTTVTTVLQETRGATCATCGITMPSDIVCG